MASLLQRGRRWAALAGLGAACLVHAPVAVAVAAQPATTGGEAHAWAPGREPHGRLVLDVPFVAQEWLLCGGAAVEMALRHQGARGIWAQDFRPLVREEEGGIRTDELAGAVEALGWRVSAGPSTTDELESRLREGRPVVTLLAEGGGRLHYVLVVGLEGGSFLVHDPAERPDVTIARARFLERWEASGRWALVVVDRDQAFATASVAGPSGGPGERPRLAAGGTPLAEASTAFRDGRWSDAAELAEQAARASPGDPATWRVLGTARYLDGDPEAALRAWNQAGSPTTETVSVSGLARTRHPVVHGLMDVRAGRTLTSGALERARRRLSLLPAAEAVSLAYRALPGGGVGVEAAVVERPLLPEGKIALGQLVLSALAGSEVEAMLSSPTGGGEALAVTGRWAEARPGAGAALTAPGFAGLPGVARLTLEWARERHRAPGGGRLSEEERSGARLVLADWATPWLFWQAGGGLDRWRGLGRASVLEAAAQVESRAVQVRAGLEAASGPRTSPGWLAWELEGMAHLTGEGPWSGRLRVSAGGVGEGAPMIRRPGAGVGKGRVGLLRAHPLEHDGALDASLLGTGALNASFEVGHAVSGDGLLGRLEVATFVDALRLRRPPAEDGGSVHAFLDVGAGLRAYLPGGTLRLDAALGAAGARALSLVWEPRKGPLR